VQVLHLTIQQGVAEVQQLQEQIILVLLEELEEQEHLIRFQVFHHLMQVGVGVEEDALEELEEQVEEETVMVQEILLEKVQLEQLIQVAEQVEIMQHQELVVVVDKLEDQELLL
jgi:hypothetical protein